MNYAFLAIWIIFFSETLVAQNIIRAEYFIDDDPGPGNGIMISGIPLDDTVSLPINVSTTGLLPGFHSLSIRVKNDQHQWSHFPVRTFYVQPPASSSPIIVDAEYFVNTDPGILNGEAIAISADDTLSSLLNLDIPQADDIGQYYVAIRMKDASGRWSHFRYDTLTVALSIPSDTIVSATAGSCSRIVNNIDAVTINNQAYTYSLSGATVGSGSGSASGVSFNVGITTVTYALVNNPSVDGQFTVTVLDNQLPIITCPDNIVQGSADTICGAIVNYIVNFNDNCPDAELTLLSGLNSGSVFPLGTTTNTFRAIDASGNSASCSFTVTISDDVPPTIDCPDNVTVGTDPGACAATNVSLGMSTLYDNCGVASSGNNALIEYPLGNTNVIWSVTDVYGLTASCVQAVIVVDNEAPVMTCPSDITAFAAPGSQPVVVNYVSPVADDNCPGVVLNQTTGLVSGSLFPVGITTNTFVATDASGTISSCSFSVLVRTGRVGVNTTSPLAMLHVADTNVVFTGATTLPTNPGNPPQNDAGGRMMWYSDKAAFRIGVVDHVRWSKDSVGVYSFATGYNTLAKASSSSAFNYQSVARGVNSTAFGHTTKSLAYDGFTAGSLTTVTGEASHAFGANTKSSGNWSAALLSSAVSSGEAAFAAASSGRAIGQASASFSLLARSIGSCSAAFGINTRAKAYCSFVLGRNNDSTAVETVNWNLHDPIFIVGNGALHTARANAMTILKNGYVGLFEMSPDYRLHVTNNNGEAGGMTEGIMIENTNSLVGEAGISFLNKAIPVTKKWIVGLNQNPNLAFAYGANFTGGEIRMMLDTTGRFGIKTITPQAQIHVVRNSQTSGPFSPDAFSIFESQLISYLQLSHPNTLTTGIFSGNENTTLRSGVQLIPDSSMFWMTSGSFIRIAIRNNGNIGIGEVDPEVKFEVAGQSILGSAGTPISTIIKQTVAIDLPIMAPNVTHTLNVPIANVETDGIVFISPGDLLPDGLIISSCRVSATGNVQIKFTNASLITVDANSMDFYLAQID